MAETTIREYRPSDVPALTALWAETFGDSEELIAAFFRLLPELGTAMVAEAEGKPIGCACVLTGMELRGTGKAASVGGYIYAVAVESAYRHNGTGRALVKAAGDKARELGAAFVCTLPAEGSLYAWYEEILGVKPALYCERRRVSCGKHERCMKLSSSEYGLRREAMLCGKARLFLSSPGLEFTRILCEAYGGGLFACGSGICAAYLEGETCLVRELICADESEYDCVAASVGAELGAAECEYRLPALSGEAYIAAESGAIPPECVWDLSFD